MHSMVGAFGDYKIERRRVDVVRGYCYRFIQCSFPCGLFMLSLSILLIIAGTIQLVFIIHFEGCTKTSTYSIKCNRQTIKVLGITFLVTGCVLLLISLIVTKYSRSSEENNVIRTTSALLQAQTSQSSSNKEQNNIIVSIR
ncbi:unnamed protein product [Didymodactylos carnosus]|uniref:Uncharacterized protein n=1 Tax=Didymodactylos carnosus TaxID=1234261 RepID=A0A813SP37_9BILA|nr:unnamed protein product [Didymodactylos carnosus]CAF1625518.1 unnamed protein product [Didymodactylos carnosus]CAF3587795.1 unnamed protein product [Didymodactylos carnosus]CAF4448050.1 unnamed protein product [Didymodactylos carnosus]